MTTVGQWIARRMGGGIAGWLGLAVFSLSLGGCTGVPDGIEPVAHFEQSRYLGTWYEIARLDHRFERGLTEVTADYSVYPDGSIRVINSGMDGSGERVLAEGRALFVGSPEVGHLKVSFFGPFYGSYVVFELSEDYEYAFVAGYSRDYLWLLARTPTVSGVLRDRFIARAQALGFAVDALIWSDAQPVTGG